MRSGTVWVNEGEDDDHFLTGRFTAFWDTGTSAGVAGELADATLEQALAWARERATVVVVSTGGQRYTAGEVESMNIVPRLPPLPADLRALERRRDPAFAHLDRTEDDEPIGWWVELEFRLPGEQLGEFAERFAWAIECHEETAEVSARPDATASKVVVGFVVSARTDDEARGLADIVLSDAVGSAAGSLPDTAAGAWRANAEVSPAESES